MKRAPIVLTGTVAGVAGILAFHTSPSRTALAGGTSASPAASASASGSSSTSSTQTTTTTSHSSSEARKSTTRTTTGEDVNYQYGDLEVKVTMSGSRITNISLAKLDVTDPRSESIDQAAIPDLEQQAISAQSAKIDGVSGASYTSQAYAQSLQSALDKLA